MLRSTLLRSTRLAPRTPTRLASSLPRAPPTDKQPFSPPPSATNEEVQRDVPGQVKFPDMAQIERQVEQVVSIPSAPDSYRSSSSPSSASSSSSSDVEDSTSSSSSEPKVITASHPSTYAGGGPSLNSQGDDVQPGQPGDSTSSLPKEADRSKDGKEDGEGNKEKSRPLNEEEVSGLWKLAGIVAGGLVVGTVTDPAWRRGERRKDE